MTKKHYFLASIGTVLGLVIALSCVHWGGDFALSLLFIVLLVGCIQVQLQYIGSAGMSTKARLIVVLSDFFFLAYASAVQWTLIRPLSTTGVLVTYVLVASFAMFVVFWAGFTTPTYRPRRIIFIKLVVLGFLGMILMSRSHDAIARAEWLCFLGVGILVYRLVDLYNEGGIGYLWKIPKDLPSAMSVALIVGSGCILLTGVAGEVVWYLMIGAFAWVLVALVIANLQLRGHLSRG